MHEMSLCQGIIDIIEDQAARQRFGRVRRVLLEIGALSHVDADAISFGFDVTSRGTIAENAELLIERISGQGYCMTCSKTVAIAGRAEPCPDCGGHQIMVVDGDQLRLKELEVE